MRPGLRQPVDIELLARSGAAPAAPDLAVPGLERGQPGLARRRRLASQATRGVEDVVRDGTRLFDLGIRGETRS
jgi:hypothetical protein